MAHRPVRLLVCAIANALLSLGLALLLWLGWRPDAPAFIAVLAVVGLGAFMAGALERGWG
jgi:CHASE2 domain-containing sensor protein